ncbi:hypothetical protein FLBR109950_12385 [Flavobacterium branchiophilum]|uniref:MORN repeat protein n=1 Tax=Flavobacterium branchiophilum (strain FL-15) TaxID=1034807 RepID=G2Z000_FLABF|nr:hypothetical protein [Flavobacterium branchiophilum]CCB69263.1 Protein of unknown function precursor [Flavobacterium branchiophilum FL-15]
MKNFTFLALLLLANSRIFAADVAPTISKCNQNTPSYSIQPLTFNEKGIDFYVFPDGTFDFNTNANCGNGSYYYKSAGRRVTTPRPEPAGVYIEQDNFGRVRRVGNTFINYDAYDRVNRIGSIFLRYNRFALEQIGGLRLIYDRYGNIVSQIGTIKPRAFYNGYAPNHGYANNYSQSNTYYGPNGYQSPSQNNGGYYYKQADNNNVSEGESFENINFEKENKLISEEKSKKLDRGNRER